MIDYNELFLKRKQLDDANSNANINSLLGTLADITKSNYANQSNAQQIGIGLGKLGLETAQQKYAQDREIYMDKRFNERSDEWIAMARQDKIDNAAMLKQNRLDTINKEELDRKSNAYSNNTGINNILKALGATDAGGTTPGTDNISLNDLLGAKRMTPTYGGGYSKSDTDIFSPEYKSYISDKYNTANFEGQKSLFSNVLGSATRMEQWLTSKNSEAINKLMFPVNIKNLGIAKDIHALTSTGVPYTKIVDVLKTSRYDQKNPDVTSLIEAFSKPDKIVRVDLEDPRGGSYSSFGITPEKLAWKPKKIIDARMTYNPFGGLFNNVLKGR